MASQQQQQQEAAVAAQPAADQDTSSSLTSSWGGEVYILLACCCYAIATVRLSMMAPGLDPVQLATSKTLTLAAASLCWLLAFQEGSVTTAAAAAAAPAAAAGEGLQLKQALAAALQSAADKWQMPDSFSHGSGMLLLVYSALGPGALAAVMQAKGQAVASAAEAQVLYSLTPVMSALLAAACLQGEEMGPLAWLGGAVIVAASLGTAVSGSGDSSRSAAAEDNNSSSGTSSGDDDRTAESASSGRRWFGGGSSSRNGTRSSSPSS
jgi:drug/metabolite transporter (DMT)-like permease